MSTLLLAWCVGLVSAMYGASTGGGGLLTVPVLMFAGLSPVEAVATSRIGSLGISISGLLAFGKEGHVDWKLGWQMAALQSVGSLFGAWSLLQLSPGLVKQAIAWIILVLLGLFLLFPSAGLVPLTIDTKSWRYRSGYVLIFLLSILTGFFQGGGGTLAAYVMILCFGQTFLQSAGTRKLPFLISNSIALAYFWAHGKVHVSVGLALGFGALLGGYLGSRYAIKQGNKWVRNGFVIIVALAAMRILNTSF